MAGAAEFFGPDDGVVIAEPEASALAGALLHAMASHEVLKEATTAVQARLSTEFDWRSLGGRWVSKVQELGIVA